MSTEKKEWYRKELKAFTVELWFQPTNEKGVLVCTSDESVVLMYKQAKYILYLNKKKIATESNQSDPSLTYSIQKGVWQHVAVTVNVEEKIATVYHNCQPVLVFTNQPISLKKTSKSQLLIGPEYLGLLTEIRVWKSCRTLDQLRSNKSTPLSIVNEMTAAVVIIDLNKLDKRTTKAAQDSEPSKESSSKGFDLGLTEKVAAGTTQDSGWDFSQPKEPSSSSSRKSSSKIEKLGSPAGSMNLTSKNLGKTAGFDLPKPKESSAQSDWGISLPPADQPKAPDQRTKNVAITSENLAPAENQSRKDHPTEPGKPSKLFSDKVFLQEYQQPLANKSGIALDELFSLSYASSDKFTPSLSATLQLCVAQARALYLKDKFDDSLDVLDAPFQHLRQLMQKSQDSEKPLPQSLLEKLSSSFSKLIPYKLFVFSIQHMQPAILPHLLTLETSPTDKTLLSVAIILQFFRSKMFPTVVMQLLGFIQQLNKKDRLSDSQRKECSQAAAWASKEKKGAGLGANWMQKPTDCFIDPIVRSSIIQTFTKCETSQGVVCDFCKTIQTGEIGGSCELCYVGRIKQA